MTNLDLWVRTLKHAACMAFLSSRHFYWSSSQYAATSCCCCCCCCCCLVPSIGHYVVCATWAHYNSPITDSSLSLACATWAHYNRLFPVMCRISFPSLRGQFVTHCVLVIAHSYMMLVGLPGCRTPITMALHSRYPSTPDNSVALARLLDIPTRLNINQALKCSNSFISQAYITIYHKRSVHHFCIILIRCTLWLAHCDLAICSVLSSLDALCDWHTAT